MRGLGLRAAREAYGSCFDPPPEVQSGPRHPGHGQVVCDPSSGVRVAKLTFGQARFRMDYDGSCSLDQFGFWELQPWFLTAVHLEEV